MDDIHNVTITLRIPETSDGVLKAYVYDRNEGGRILATDHAFTYSNPKISWQEGPRLTAFFPTSLLPEAEEATNEIKLTAAGVSFFSDPPNLIQKRGIWKTLSNVTVVLYS